MPSRPTAVISGLLVALCLVLGPAPSAHAVSRATYEADVIKFTNQQRVQRKLVALKSRACLERYAEAQARASVKRQSLKHSNLRTIMKACKLSGVGENIAMGYPSGSAVVKGWMGSPGHRANILNRSYRLIGVGAYPDSKGRWWSAQIFGY